MLNPGADFNDLEPGQAGDALDGLFNVIFSCVSMGQVVAQQFATAGGTQLSQASIDCIDAGFAEVPIEALINQDPSLEADMTRIIFQCLSPEELAGLGG